MLFKSLTMPIPVKTTTSCDKATLTKLKAKNAVLVNLLHFSSTEQYRNAVDRIPKMPAEIATNPVHIPVAVYNKTLINTDELKLRK